MSYTSFGEFMRILRIQNHEVMGEIAKMLNVTTPFLSAVENGKKNVPQEWIDKIIDHYNLDASEQDKLIKAIDESKTQYKINTSNLGNSKRKAAMQFARSLENLDDDTINKIMALLNEQDGGENGF